MNEQEKILLEEAIIFRDNINSSFKDITKSMIDHRILMIKDFNTLASIFIPALIVLINEQFIQIKVLFFIGLSFLFIQIIINFAYQRVIYSKEEQLSMNMERYLQKLHESIIKCRLEPLPKNYKELDDLLSESFQPVISTRKSLFHRHGQVIIFSTFMIGLFCIALSLIDVC